MASGSYAWKIILKGRDVIQKGSFVQGINRWTGWLPCVIHEIYILFILILQD